MRETLAAVVVVLALFAPACQTVEVAEPTPTPGPSIDPAGIPSALLTAEDVGEGFESDEPVPSTVEIGGRAGPSSYTDVEAQGTVAFRQVDGTGFVNNTVYLLESVAKAQAFMLAHTQAEADSWTQERTDGGSAVFELEGRVADLNLGDEIYTARLKATITDPGGEETERAIEYVAYRIDRLLSFVVTQDLGAGVFARRQEQRMARLIE